MSNTAQPITLLDPISRENPLSTQLQRLTGSTWGSQSFYSEHLGKDQCVPAGVVVHRESGERFFVPVLAHEMQRNPLDTIAEIARIERYCGGVDGYQWGNTSGPDGDYGREKLDRLVEIGLARRTGKSRANGLGGVWPEVEVTPLGREVLNAYSARAKSFESVSEASCGR